MGMEALPFPPLPFSIDFLFFPSPFPPFPSLVSSPVTDKSDGFQMRRERKGEGGIEGGERVARGRKEEREEERLGKLSC